MNSIEREIRDLEIVDKCHKCCISCDKYNTVKEQKQNCEVRQARHRINRREMYRAIKKAKKLNGGD